MRNIEAERILIISNNVLSTTNNNGKTILSYFEGVENNQIRQLYFSNEEPEVFLYKYYRLSDIDVIKGRLNKAKRGMVWETVSKRQKVDSVSHMHSYSDFLRLFREMIWIGGWKSEKLLKWLDEFKPTIIFFVGGDSCFAYRICKYIKKRYQARLAMYITDDYFMPRKREGIWHRLRRKFIRYSFKQCLKNTDVFFTITDSMRKAYKKEFGKDSYQIVNMCESMKDCSIEKKDNTIKLIYTGSVYYGRDYILGKLSETVERYVEKNREVKISFNIYTNNRLGDKEQNTIIKGENTHYCGSLNRDELKKKLNQSDILVFIESFLETEKEKTKYSLSTKIPEYLSLGKPILAIGPRDIGSIKYLEGAAMIIDDEKEMDKYFGELLNSSHLQESLAKLAERKFIRFNDKKKVQKIFFERLLGD